MKDILNPKKKDQKAEPIFIEPPKPQPTPVVEPKEEPNGPKFERYVVKVREGKFEYDRVFWFDEEGNRVPDEVVKDQQEKGQLRLFNPESDGGNPQSDQQESPAPPAQTPGANNAPSNSQTRGDGGRKQSS